MEQFRRKVIKEAVSLGSEVRNHCIQSLSKRLIWLSTEEYILGRYSLFKHCMHRCKAFPQNTKLLQSFYAKDALPFLPWQLVRHFVLDALISEIAVKMWERILHVGRNATFYWIWKARHRCQKLNFAHIFKEITFSYMPFLSDWCFLQIIAAKSTRKRI